MTSALILENNSTEILCCQEFFCKMSIFFLYFFLTRKMVQYTIVIVQRKDILLMNKFTNVYQKDKEIFLYIIFGFLTFLTDTLVFWLLDLFIELNHSVVALHLSSVFATLVAITFAYITNRKIVFNSNNRGKKAVLTEIAMFFSARIFTMLLAEIFLQILVFNFLIKEVVSKITVNVIVIVLNYIFSKLFIFKTEEKK